MTNCNFCHKKGLLIYPVRYAVASPYGADGVPGLSGNFRIEDAPQAAGAAKYTYHIRHYEVDEAGNVIRAFSIGRKWVSKENIQDLLAQWNYWCSYMNHGPAELPKPPLFFKEHENALESFLFCLYDIGTRAPVAYRIALMPHILIMTGYRLMALWTCRDPVWPQAVKDVSLIEPDDPYDEPRGNTPIGWGDTVLATQRGDYPDDPKMEIKDWKGEADPALNALLWAKDVPPKC
ncbi:MAG TPA: DUF6708 domain-containing protein [Herbaspirillum sp.]|uniref:DUF6708 domain-containing protein n=1 Tax=Herbaspirillum sp. TaxID=1890675 RepID=UPI002D5FAAFF|nr:DUF6708 domain-containing protein [Herbaspirillum sp.]HZG20312.1 DUF6708 domain-containing protein [Herbaspirillum sp.]